ncbi:MAG: GNAT family N-acetyltransferase [Candidatus Micrarchaeia archaeon]
MHSLELRAPETPAEWEKYYDVRYRMLRKQLGMPKGEEKKPEDENARHMALFLDGALIGVGMVYPDSGNARIRFIAIDEKYQHAGYGKILVESLEGIARKQGFGKTVLWGDEKAVGFYEKLGYRNVGKGPSLFGKIQQYNMEKKL